MIIRSPHVHFMATARHGSHQAKAMIRPLMRKVLFLIGIFCCWKLVSPRAGFASQLAPPQGHNCFQHLRVGFQLRIFNKIAHLKKRCEICDVSCEINIGCPETAHTAHPKPREHQYRGLEPHPSTFQDPRARSMIPQSIVYMKGTIC